VEEVYRRLEVDPQKGLDAGQAGERLQRYGHNTLQAREHEPLWEEFLEELREPMILLLLFTGVLYAIWGGVADTITIFVVILLLVATEVFNERRAGRAIEGLRELSQPDVGVLRAGKVTRVAWEEIVPGDILFLQAGDRVPADARLIEAIGLAADESPLTGESVPSEKEAVEGITAETPLSDRRNSVFAGTAITRGKGTAVVVATGAQTELGRIAKLSAEVGHPITPLQRTMNDLTRWMVWVALGFSILVPLLGWLIGGQSPRQMVLTGLSLVFATIPEELPIIITMVLALGGYRLAHRNAIARDLQAVETLGTATVIATDKTGTLTENRLSLQYIWPEPASKELLRQAVLCNDALPGDESHGDPLDVALLNAARAAGLDPAGVRQESPLVSEFSFDNTRKRMSVIYKQGGALGLTVKGAAEAVLERCTTFSPDGSQPLDAQAILDQAAAYAAQGMRVLAFAQRQLPADAAPSQDEAEADLTFVGLVALLDPPRQEAAAAVAACRSAGIRVIMITGDHPLTAKAIAERVGMDGRAEVLTGPDLDKLSDADLAVAVRRTSIFARITPQQKLRIVQALQQQGERVAVTGDGVNDAPALVAADIGVAMGLHGTDVAREAADVVLADDNFSTIVEAVREGRMLFANLRKGVRYYLACKLAMILIVLIPTLLRIPIPFAPVQIILMELFMDLAASAGFVAEGPEGNLMSQPPRDPRAPFLDRSMVSGIVTSSLGLFLAVEAAYLFTWFNGGQQVAPAQTTAFFTWLAGHIFLAFNLRSDREPLFALGWLGNRVMLGWAAAVAVFILLVTFVPPLQSALRAAPLSGGQWLAVIIAALVGTFWIDVRKMLAWRPRSAAQPS
jgi:Ca2+-transporting ATPase